MLKNQFFQAGLFLTNYLQNSLLEDPKHQHSDQAESDDKKEETPYNGPPQFLKPIFELGRPYFTLNYTEALNNIWCLFVPVGKVKPLVPDLYMPSVSVFTFMIASSVILCMKSRGKRKFEEALYRTLTKFLLVNLCEVFLLSALLYFLSRAFGPESNPPSPQRFPPQPSPAEISQAYGPFSGGRQAAAGFPSPTHQQGYQRTQSVPQSKPVSPRAKHRLDVMLPEVLFVIGYKYVLVNCFLFLTTLFPFRVVTVVLMIYVSVASPIFSIRSIKSLRSLQSNSSNPIIFIFPVLQPLFFYILLPSNKF